MRALAASVSRPTGDGEDEDGDLQLEESVLPVRTSIVAVIMDRRRS